MIRFLPISLCVLCAICGVLRAAAVPEVPKIESAKITGQAEAPATPLTLWYREPAKIWEEALPVGNGHLGAMVFGGVASERIQLNEATLWDGYPIDRINPDALKTLPQIRQLIFQGDEDQATQLIGSAMMGVPPRIKSYQPLGDFIIDSPGIDHASNYRRSLDLSTGIASTTYTVDGVNYTREVFASFPDNVIVVRLAADQPGKINADFSMRREKDARSNIDPAQNTLGVWGQIMSQYVDVAKKTWGLQKAGMRFEGFVSIRCVGARHFSFKDETLSYSGADSITLLIAANTDYNKNGTFSSIGENGVDQLCRDDITKAAAKSYDDLRKSHLADIQSLLSRVTLDLGPSPAEVASLSTDERIKRLNKSDAADPDLIATYFQYGRYLLASSSRSGIRGSMPANLQGIWNQNLNASWNSDYHTNINIQMNYWPAEVTNLSECHLPLFDLMDNLAVAGAKTAKLEYGANGWVVHHLTDPFLTTTPCDGPPGVWPMGAAWLCQHLWEHYAFTGDKTFLANRAYPLMKGAAQFILDFLVTAPPDSPVAGKLVTCPSYSPENKFITPDGKTASFTYASTMDLEIIHDLLTHTIAAANILGTDPDFRDRCQKTLDNLAPLQISKADGRLQEWVQDFEEQDPHHRHTSHLFAVYPGDQITLSATPDLAVAARKSLEARTDKGATEWSFAWRAALWARFQDGDHAHQLLTELMSKDLYPNLFNKYPPFQIDGNFGATAAIAEMLLQSQSNEIRLLPALPKAWPTGKVTGLRARGGFQIDIAWENNALTRAKIQSTIGLPVRIRSSTPLAITLSDQPVQTTQSQPDLLEFPTQPGQTFIMTPAKTIH